MPANRKSLAMHIRALMCQRLTDYYFPEGGVEFIPGTAKTRGEVGIHLLNPETWDIDHAAANATRDGFEKVYVYTEDEEV
jgi:hypothetical protein